jgi:hypothetical protein
MLTSEIPDEVTKDDVSTLIDALKRNVSKTDDWQQWLYEDEWSDGKIYRCLEYLEDILNRHILM